MKVVVNWLLAALTSAALSGCVGISSRSMELVGHEAPTTRIVLEDGTYTTLDEYRGRTVILNFWALMCHKSKDATIDLNDVAKRYRGVDGVIFLAPNLDRFEDADKARKFISENKLTYLKHVFSGNDIHDEAYVTLRGDIVPYIAIIDEQGTLVQLTTSPDDVEDYLMEKFHR